MLKLRPWRNPDLEWSEEDGIVTIQIKHQERRKSGWKSVLVGLFLPAPPDRKVELDTIGSEVWLLIDGQRTMGDIAAALAQKYQLAPREAELSLQQYCKELGRRGYVGFVKPTAPDSQNASNA